MTLTLASLGARECRRLLRSRPGLALRTGPFATRIHSPLAAVAESLHSLYAGYELAAPDEFIDFEVEVSRPGGWRRWLHSQVVFRFDGEEPFNPLPGNQGYPLLEWGMNWCVYGMCHQYLILHAAVLERRGRAMIIPAPSGSGKSTLCAALLFSGWRLLSDELTLIDPHDGSLVPIPRPVSLKNESIEVIRAFAPQVRFGSLVEETSKGVVAHFAAPADSVSASRRRAMPAWVVLPRYRAGLPARLEPLERARAFMHLVENAFNYAVFGREGFELLAGVVDRSRCFSFEYSSVHEAAAVFASLADSPTR